MSEPDASPEQADRRRLRAEHRGADGLLPAGRRCHHAGDHDDLRVLHRRDRRRRNRSQPDLDLPGDLRRHRPELVLPLGRPATERITAEFNLQQTLLVTTPLILTGLAVAFAFRCGMFNIGGQGQYTMGAITAVWVGTTWAGMPGIPHAFLAIVFAMLAGALWAGIAGILKATVGAHEVITTIMLNWIAYWVGTYLFGLGGPLQNDVERVGADLERHRPERRSCTSGGGTRSCKGCTSGSSSRSRRCSSYWFILNRTTLGYEVRAVGYNPEAARYAGINVARNYFLAMAIAGSFAGLGGALDILGWQYRLGVARHPDVADRLHRHRGRAARAQHGGRRRALRAALRRAALRDVHAQPRPRGLPAGARREPDADDPGARPALRRRRPARRLRLEHSRKRPLGATAAPRGGPG